MITGTYNLTLVAVSFVVACMAAYTSLEFTRRAADTRGSTASLWLVAGSICMGFGIWTMHFVGMLALQLPIEYTHEPVITAISLLVAIVASALAFFIVTAPGNGWTRIALGGFTFGCGIGGMHYLGMLAMQLNADMEVNPAVFLLSLVIAIFVSSAALWIMAALLREPPGSRAQRWFTFIAAITMGTAICGVHYTGMAAIGYRPHFGTILLEQPYSNSSMVYLLSGVCLVLLCLSLVSSRVGERLLAVDAHWRGAKRDADVLGQILDNLAKEVYIARYVADIDAWKIVYVNQSAIRNLGYARGELTSMSPDQINAEMRGNEMREVVVPLLNGTTSLVNLETTHRRADGSVYPVELQVQLVMGNDEPILVVIATDVTEKRQKEEQLRQSNKLESIRQLASGIAQEINTPAQFVGDNIRFVKTAVNDLIELVEQLLRVHRAALAGEVPPSLAEEIEEVVNLIDPSYIVADIPDAIKQSLDGITRIARIVRAMKEFAHPGGEDPEFIDLNQVLRNTIIVASNEWKYVAELDKDLDDSLPPVPCLQQEISQVVLNLIVNAAHAITEAKEDDENQVGRIFVGSRLDGDFAVISVSDTGAGIPEEIRDRVFDPFFMIKEVGKGTGQGLALAYQSIVNTHGGSIDIDSEEGQGTTFTLRLPLQIAAINKTEAVA